MEFQHAHFGDGLLNESVATFDAARLYSALFLEGQKLDKEKEFIELSQKDDFVLSDAFPFIEGQPFLPKPIGYPKYQEDKDQDLKKVRQAAKKLKKIAYIPSQNFKNFLERRVDIQTLFNLQNKLMRHTYTTQKGVDPFEVGVSAYKNALYVFASQSPLLDELMDSLQYSGIGGKKSSGLGQFRLEILSIPVELNQLLVLDCDRPVMSLATNLPKNKELTSVLKNANYLLKKSSGFAYSQTAGELLRKQDLYKFKAGSTFACSFRGSIVDVRPNNFPHPVWNFSKGLFYRLGQEEK